MGSDKYDEIRDTIEKINVGIDAKDSRISALEAENERLFGQFQECAEKFAACEVKYRQHTARLQAAVDGMAKTLRFYGCEPAWREPPYSIDFQHDRGKKARDCLTQHAELIREGEDGRD